MRDEKIPIISFVANTGGLLGLCMGFSLVSVFEIVFHCGGAMKKEFMRRKRQQISRKADDGNHTVVQNHINDNSFFLQVPPFFLNTNIYQIHVQSKKSP